MTRSRVTACMIAGLALGTAIDRPATAGEAPVGAHVPGVTHASLWPGFSKDARAHVSQRLPALEMLAPQTGGALFVGDSITEGAPLDRMFPGLPTSNLGIGWDTSDGLLLRLDQVRRHRPDRLFILIGTNDFGYGHTPEHVARNIVAAVEELASSMPGTRFYVISILPRETEARAFVEGTNRRLAAAAQPNDFTWLDLGRHMSAEDGALSPDLTEDGLHLNGRGYAVWAELMDRCARQDCDSI